MSRLPDSLDSQLENLKQTARGLLKWAGGSIFLILVYALSGWHEGLAKVLLVFSHGTLIAVAFGSVGTLIGFLFGIPRTLQSDSPKTANGQRDDASRSYRQNVNTNLEQISDWLTKILVGVGLTQLREMPQRLMGLASYFQSGLNNNPAVALAVILNSMVFGFFAGYLLTRLFLASAFRLADPDFLSNREQFARGLTEAGAYGKAISELEDTLRQVNPGLVPIFETGS